MVRTPKGVLHMTAAGEKLMRTVLTDIEESADLAVSAPDDID
jgi:hypothetical protein